MFILCFDSEVSVEDVRSWWFLSNVASENPLPQKSFSIHRFKQWYICEDRSLMKLLARPWSLVVQQKERGTSWFSSILAAITKKSINRASYLGTKVQLILSYLRLDGDNSISLLTLEQFCVEDAAFITFSQFFMLLYRFLLALILHYILSLLHGEQKINPHMPT